MLRVLLREDVVRDDERAAAGRDETRHQRLDQGGLAGANRAADADSRKAGCAVGVEVREIVVRVRVVCVIHRS